MPGLPFLVRVAGPLLAGALLVLGGCDSSPEPNDPSGNPGAGTAGGGGRQGGSGQAGGNQAGGSSDPGNGGADGPSSGTSGGSTAGAPGLPGAFDAPPGSFESDLPNASGQGGATGGAGGVGGTGAGAAPTADSGALGAGGGAQRAIIEADIVQVAGDKLYALSRVAGLSVIDIANPAALRLLGSYRELTGTPFEMYLRDGVAVVMFTSWGQYVKQADGSFSWVQASKVVALDVANPAAIQRIGGFDVAGEVSDSRLVGDVLYVVGYQSGACWGCTQNQPLTSVLSLNIADPRAIRRVDELKLLSSNEQWGGGKRSISVTTERIYVAGPEYGQQQPTGSTIQVVDISDPGGDLVQGTQVTVAGQITNRWQIDEYQGALRVVSQPWQWPSSTPPSVQTYRVASSQQLTALGNTTIQMPPNERLQSVRFDGPRGYAITAERVDPLFTLDLSDPARPRQVGELVMPGWVYHMEPRGDRVIGLGYDQGNEAGAITVSIFDVSNLANPRMLSRVNFGGDWASLPEDQDRIHKSFKILDQLGLILVPFSGWSSWSNSKCSSDYRSGIQLIDFSGDTLAARGLAPSRGEARRALVHGSSLLAVSDEAVDAFDMSNRGAPAALGQLTIARNVTRAMPLSNGHVARINQDWYAQTSTVDIVALGSVDRPDLSVGEVDLSKALQGDSECAYNAWFRDAHVNGTQLYVSYGRYNFSEPLNSFAYHVYNGVLVVDATDPAAPRVLSKLEWLAGNTSDEWYPFYGYYNYGYIGPQTNMVRTERALVTLEQRTRSWNSSGQANYDLRLRVIDLTDPRAPSESTLALPAASGYAGLAVDGEDVLLSHLERNDTTGRGRFFIDRVELSDPKQPRLTDKLNVPGALLHLDREHGRAVTSELVRTTIQATPNDCYARFGYAEFAYPGGIWSGDVVGTCTGFTQRLQLVRFVNGGVVLEDTHQLGERDRISSSSLGDGRVVAVLSHGYAGWYFYGPFLSDCFGCGYGYYGASTDPSEVLVLGGLASGSFEVGRLAVDDGGDPWWGFYGAPPVYAVGTKALVLSRLDAAIIDTSVAADPKLLRSVPLFGSAQSLGTSGNLALLALGMNGVQRIDL